MHEFDVKSLTRVSDFPGQHRGGVFASSTTRWDFLDGGIIDHQGYGWGSHFWAAVDGVEALRATCLLLGIKQPRAIKGEQVRRPLANLLEDLSAFPLNPDRRSLLNWPASRPAND